ncbi:hypothetical protein GC176_03605 [bacterium]|nr:hypothetical protein [bacterium]
MISVSYCSKNGSPCDSASRMPSVISLTYVFGLVVSVKRTLKPTAAPTDEPSSSATRDATDRAAIRRGCVCPIVPSTPRPIPRQISGSCVDFPEPVSPQTMITWLSRIASSISARRVAIGSSSLSLTPGVPAARCDRRSTDACNCFVSLSRLRSNGFFACAARSIDVSSRRSENRSASIASPICFRSCLKSGADDTAGSSPSSRLNGPRTVLENAHARQSQDLRP